MVLRTLRVRVAGGEPQPVAGLGQGAFTPSIQGSRMAHVQAFSDPPGRIWRIPGPGASPRDRAPEILIESNGADTNAAYSPDGRRIAFESTRSGQYNIWVCDSDGSHPVQLTDFHRQTGTPRWSPDGRRIAFDSLKDGDWNVYVIDADGRPPGDAGDVQRLSRSLVTGRAVDLLLLEPGGSSQIWRIPSVGGAAVQVTRGGAAYAEVSGDGRLYWAKSEFRTGIWRMLEAGGEEAEVLRGPIPHALDWALSATSLFFSTTEERRGPGAEHVIHSLDFESGEVTELFRRTGPFSHGGLAVSPDEEWVLYGESSASPSELMLVENFR